MAYTTIDKPTDYFNTVLYTANNGTLNVTGVGFQPDWVWIKGRSYTAHHNVYDVIRGVQKDLLTSSTVAESSSGELTSFDSDGFTVVDSATDRANYLTNTHVSWNWLAGGTASSNTDGSITSSVSANTTAGFSIVSYTGNGTSGATIGHGLSAKPSWIVTKRRNSAEDWANYHSSLTADNYMYFTTNASTNDATKWNDTEPTSSVFSVGNHASVNGSSDTYIAYCFAEKKGYSKFGSYVGNGSTDGSYIHLGMKPAFFMLKKSSGSGTNWEMLDSTRNPGNPMDKRTRANTNEAESTSTRADFLSNGIKIRTAGGETNASGATYIYMAFAENPFVTSTGIPTTAR